MRKWPLVLVLALLLSDSEMVSADDALAGSSHFQILLCIRQGDPLGSVESRSLMVLAEKKLVAHEKRQVRFGHGESQTVGDEVVPVGSRIGVMAERAPDGRVRLRVKADGDGLNEKLDRILDRLERLDRRIESIEKKHSGPAGAYSTPSPDLGWFAHLIGSLFGAHLLDNHYSLTSSPNVRMSNLLKQSEDMRGIRNEWEHFWFTDQPSKFTFDRVPGGIR